MSETKLFQELQLERKEVEALRRAAREDRMPINKMLADAARDYLEYRRVELRRMEI